MRLQIALGDIRFAAAEQPNETSQSNFTHYRLATGADSEISTWLDAHTGWHSTSPPTPGSPDRSCWPPSGKPLHGYPASILTDNGTVYTTRFAGGRGGRNHLEHELRRLHITQKNSRPNHPTTCGKVERFQQTMKKWLAAQPDQPTTLDQLQTLIGVFLTAYNHDRPHRSLPHRATPATAYAARPKAGPGADRSRDTQRPGPHRPHRLHRLPQPPPGRPPPPHRHRPNPRRNPRPAPGPGPAHPRHRRRHRRTPPRTHPRPHPRLPAHRPTTRTHPEKALARTHESWVRAMPMSCDITARRAWDSNPRRAVNS
ncbi:integrase core domain-containing protein [Modestobacter marinus]|uniref:integrase core domain-containing protein n=1 Tax=Modestobacter marinus TaxID=477641 RepID=UPI001ABBA140